jgi:multiple sugar transport system permease protein
MPRRNTAHLLGKRNARSENIAGYLFTLPWIIGFVCFVGGPMLFSLVMAFMRWDFLKPSRFVGLANFITIFKDRNALIGLKTTSYYTVLSVPFQMVCSILLAQLVNHSTRGTKAFVWAYYLPSVLSGAVMGTLWGFIYSRDLGLLNYLLAFVGIQPIGWLLDSKIAMLSVVIMNLWGIGIPMVVFLAGLQNIPTSYYEAASIDGAGPLSKFFRITLPMLTPTILFMLIMNIISSFQVLAPVMILTGGGPAQATAVYALYEYKTAFSYMRMGYASSMAWLMTIIMLVVTLFVFWSSRFWVFYESKRGTMF